MNVEIAERLAKRRREAGYSQENLAEKLGVSRQAVSKWERSESSPDTDNLISLAQLYGVSLDDLLFVDESLRDDMAFETVDRAAAQKATSMEGALGASQEPRESDNVATDNATTDNAAAESGAMGNASVNNAAADSTASDDSEASKRRAGKFKADMRNRKGDKVHIGFDGIHVIDGDDFAHVTWRDGVHVKNSKKGEEVYIGPGGVHVNEEDCCGGEDPASTSQFCDHNSEDWHDGKVIINGKEYDSWHDANVAFKDSYGMRKNWLKFPFPLVAIIAYLLFGFLLGAWAVGLFVFFLIPVYYMIAHAAYSKRLGQFLEGFYPMACLAWFLWMAAVLGQPHPAWVIFLTIPVAAWIIHATSKSYRRHKKAAEVIETTDDDDDAANSAAEAAAGAAADAAAGAAAADVAADAAAGVMTGAAATAE